MCSVEIRKGKAQLELRIEKDVQSHKKAFYMYIGSKRKANKKVGLVISEEGNLVTEDMEESEVLKVAFFSEFTTKVRSQASQVSEPSGRDKDIPVLTSLLVEYDPLTTTL